MSALRWLHKNEFLVHMFVMIVSFYGIPIAVSLLLYPSFIQPLITAMVSGLIIVAIGAVSFRVAIAATDAVKSALDRAVLRDITSRPEPMSQPADKIIDYTSPNTLLLDEDVQALKDAVAAMGEVGSAIAPVSESDANSTSIAPKKRRGRPSKSERGEG